MSLHQTIRDSLPVRLGNRKYNIAVGRLARSTVDPIRQGFDTQGQPGEQSLNQAELPYCYHDVHAFFYL